MSNDFAQLLEYKKRRALQARHDAGIKRIHELAKLIRTGDISERQRYRLLTMIMALTEASETT